MEIPRGPEEDHAAVEATAVQTIRILIRYPGDGDISGTFLEDFVEVGDEDGVGVKQEDAWVEVEPP